jgi:hypothetical protein
MHAYVRMIHTYIRTYIHTYIHTYMLYIYVRTSAASTALSSLSFVSYNIYRYRHIGERALDPMLVVVLIYIMCVCVCVRVCVHYVYI